MKIEVVKGTIAHEGKDYGMGKTLDIDNAKAERLIGLGYAKQAGGGKPEAAEKPDGSDKK